MSSPDRVRRTAFHVIMIRMDSRITITVRTQQGPVMAHMEIAGCRTAARIRTVLKAIITALMKTGRDRASIHMVIVRIGMVLMETSRSMRVVLERTRMILMEIDRGIRTVHTRMIPMETSRGIRVERIRIIPTEISRIKAVVRSSRIYTALMQCRPGRIIPG